MIFQSSPLLVINFDRFFFHQVGNMLVVSTAKFFNGVEFGVFNAFGVSGKATFLVVLRPLVAPKTKPFAKFPWIQVF